jgi:hypothetical protein
MNDEEEFNAILTNAYKRMHRYTCAEASLQCLLQMWDLPLETLSWATGGYMGAISSGITTCGLLIGSSIAIGFRCGLGTDSNPEQNPKERNRAIKAVSQLYKDFLKEFNETECKKLCKYDFSNPNEAVEYAQKKGYKSTCDIFIKFVINKCNEMVEKGKI